MSAVARTFLACVFTAHLVLTAAGWWLMPGGFPPSHARFWCVPATATDCASERLDQKQED
jgi:hypothetical protein